jgi:hypothetical protein
MRNIAEISDGYGCLKRSGPETRHQSLAGIHGKRMVGDLASDNVPWRKAARLYVPSPILNGFLLRKAPVSDGS